MKTTDVKRKLLNIEALCEDRAWYEGYISALADNKIISEPQFDILVGWDCKIVDENEIEQQKNLMSLPRKNRRC